MNRRMLQFRAALRAWPRVRTGPHLVACHYCDTLHTVEPLDEGKGAHCVRCGAVLLENKVASLVRVSSFSVAAMILMVLGHMFPFLTMDAAGMRMNLTLIGSALALFQCGGGYVVLGVLIVLFTVVAPLTLVGGLFYVCFPLSFGRAFPGLETFAKWAYWCEPWNMVEVFLLGVLVSLLKIAKIADVEFGPGFWLFCGVVLCSAAAFSSIEKEELWDRIEVAKR